MFFYFGENTLRIVENFKIFKSEHTDIFAFKVQGSFFVVFYTLFGEMIRSVEFYGKPVSRAIEIEDVTVHTVLPKKANTVYLTFAHHAP